MNNFTNDSGAHAFNVLLKSRLDYQGFIGDYLYMIDSFQIVTSIKLNYSTIKWLN